MIDKDKVYVIGEIGQNHNGSVDMAKLLVDLVCMPTKEDNFGLSLKGMDAVKLTKRDLSQELSNSMMNQPYDSPNSFGRTYGEHRAALELNDEEHYEVYKYAKEKGLDFVETLCAPGCLSIFRYFQPDYLKVASRDLTNIPLLEAMAETKVPMILSTGMASKSELDDGLTAITKYHSDISILHCVSEYPTHPNNANLRTILYLQKHYPEYVIGYSDHTIGISAPVSAMAMGAKIIEKHITINRGLKGTDQIGSLGPDGIARMMRDIRLIEMSLGEEDMFISDSTVSARKKLERSIAVNKKMFKGDVISEEDLHMLSPGDGFKWMEKSKVIGKTLIKDIGEDEVIYQEYLA
ncbi:MAG: N-acetylneuraminate synthase family protein [Flavobacteriales bacterium]|nr:N-acetylneuraminate synthase family protein [Flavobacteriales bacterium]